MGRTCIAGGGCDKTHVLITLVTDTMLPSTHFASHLPIPRVASTLICDISGMYPTKALAAQSFLDVDAVLSAFK